MTVTPPAAKLRVMATIEATKWIYDFAEGSREMRDLLGGKGANVAEMTRVLGPDLIPAGFTITTAACVAYMRNGNTAPDGLADAVDDAIERLEQHAGRRLGDAEDPLLVSVRSGARDSMPGMMDSVLNLGLNDESVEGLAARTGNPRFAWDCYRRLVQMFGNVVLGVPGARFEDEIARIKRERAVTLDTELDAEALRELTRRFQTLFDFPTDPREQLRQAVEAVFGSWMGDRAVAYRRINGIPDDWGTAVNVQQMVFGNHGPTSASGVAFSRDEVTGAPEPSGDFLVDAQGEDVVSGMRTPRDLSELADWMPDAHRRLSEILRTLERHFKDMQDTEFTIEDGRLYMLQTRSAKRPAQAAVRFAVDAVEEGLLTRAEAIATIDARRARRAAAPDVRPGRALHGDRARRRGVARRGEGRDRVHRAGRRGRRRGRARRDPRAAVHRGRRRRRLPRRPGHPHLRGRQGLARGARRTRHGPPGRDRRRRRRRRPPRPRGPDRRTGAPRGRPDRDRRVDRPHHARRRAARHAAGRPALRAPCSDGATSCARSACAPTPTRRRTRGGRASSAPRASGSAAPSTCSWRRTASRRCSGW